MVFTKNVAPRWLLLLVGLLLGAPLLGRAQIVDDSTKTLYGPRTTRVIYEDEVRRDSTRGILIDTSLVRWPQQRFWFHDSTFQQDLGTVGSASRPLLYQPNLQLGARIGRNAFDKYALDASQVPYYDSRSPYSFFRYIQSGSGEQVFQLSYSRSLRKNFSVGANYERFASNKVLGTNTSEGLVEHNAARFFVRYQTDDERYHLLAAIVDTRHRAVEQGGILPLASDTNASGRLSPNNLFIYDRTQVYLTAATNTDDRDQFHLYHSYRLLGRGLTAYHILDLRRQYNGYVDNAIPYTTTETLLYYPTATTPLNTLIYYPTTLRNPNTTADRSTYRQAENTLGLSGRTDRVAYSAYARYRGSWWRANSTVANSVNYAASEEVIAHGFAQFFVGGTASFNYRTIYAVEVSGEYLPYDSNPYLTNPVRVLGVNAEYWLRGRIRTGPLSAELLTTAYSPTLTQQEFIGNNYRWPSLSAPVDFTNTKATQLTVRLQQRLPLLADHTLEASVAVVNINNLVYYAANPIISNPSTAFEQLLGPQQLSASKQLLIAFARHRFRVGKIFVDNQGTYTLGADTASAGLRIPKLVTESRVYYQTHVFKKALLGQIGAELYYQSVYKGYGYSPSTQQFFVQDRFTIRNYAVANVFLTADIKAATIFLKVAYVNQGIGHDGYFTTPLYTGYPRRLQFGVRWRFFT
ncbi:MAG: putative porin [Janthinobacterium lividum]